MDLIDQMQSIATKIERQRDHIQTEEATKNAFIMPFISALGYDVFDPTEVVPEFTADVGIKKGEKADYAIFKDSPPYTFFLLNGEIELNRYRKSFIQKML